MENPIFSPAPSGFTPSSLSGNQFYIQTGLCPGVGASANPYMLTYNSANSVNIQQWAIGDQSQIWIFNDNGTISPASAPNIVLTSNSTSGTSSSSVSVEAPSAKLGNAQNWTCGNGMLSVDMGGTAGTLYLNVANGTLSSANQIITYEAQNANNELWYVLPAQSIPLGTCFYLQSEMPNASGDNAVYVLAIPDSITKAGTQLVIDAQKEDALNQLWFVNPKGLLVSALDRTMAISTLTGEDLQVSIQPIGTDIQNWYLLPNGLLANGGTGANYYANVSGGGTAASGKAVISYGHQYASNAMWQMVSYQPGGMWFTIELGSSKVVSNILLTSKETGNAFMDVPLGPTINGTARPAISQLWRRTIAGNIISAWMPDMALTATGSSVNSPLTLSPLIPGSAAQIFSWQEGREYTVKGDNSSAMMVTATLVNQGLCVYGDENGTLVLKTVVSGKQITDEYLFQVFPSGMPIGESTTFRNVAGGTSPDLYLTLAEKPSSGCYQVSAGEVGPSGPAFTMWEFQYPGYLVSGINSDLVLSLGLDSGSTTGNPVFTETVVAYSKQPKAQLFQLWTVTTDGLIVNQYNGQALTIANPVLTSASPDQTIAVTTADIGTEKSYQYWDFSPGMALQTVLQQPALSFPGGTAEEQQAYTILCFNLGLPGNDIRPQYLNLAAPLAIYQSALNILFSEILAGGTLPLPPSMTSPYQPDTAVYKSVITQLNKEILKVSAVQLLFQQANTLYLSLSQAQAMTLSELITACALPDGLSATVPTPKKKKSWIADLVEGILSTSLNLFSVGLKDPGFNKEFSTLKGLAKNGLSGFANLMSTGLATYQGIAQSTPNYAAKIQKAEENIYNYGMTVGELQQNLLNEFKAAGTGLGEVETVILSDWCKLQSVAEMTQTTGSMSSLYWPSSLTAQDVGQMLNSYTEGVLKALIPANSVFKITATLHTNINNMQPAGLYNGSYYIDNKDGTQNRYSVNLNAPLNSIVWACGTNPVSFYTGLNGWSIPKAYQNINIVCYDTNNVPASASSLVTIENCTNLELAVATQLVYETETAWKSIPNIKPYDFVQLAGGSFAFPNNSPSGGSIKNYNLAALSTASMPGIAITLEGTSTPVASFDINNNYGSTTSKTVEEIPNAVYTTTNLVVQAPFDCIINTKYDPTGMAYINVVITAS